MREIIESKPELVIDLEYIPNMSDSDVIDADRLWTHPEELLASGHKANDKYLKNLRSLQRVIHSARKGFKNPRHAKALDEYMADPKGITTIAKNNRMAFQTLKDLLATRQARQYLFAKQCYLDALDGPSLAMRREMLWRIATNNEHKKPVIAIAAIKQLDVQAGVGQPDLNAGTGGIQIVIQQFSAPTPTHPPQISTSLTIDGESEVVQDDE